MIVMGMSKFGLQFDENIITSELDNIDASYIAERKRVFRFLQINCVGSEIGKLMAIKNYWIFSNDSHHES